MKTIKERPILAIKGEQDHKGWSISGTAERLKKELKKIDYSLLLYPYSPNQSIIKLSCFTIVHLSVVIKGQTYEALGFARKSKKDKDNPVLAEQIAKGRAMKALEMKMRGRAIDKKYMG